MSLFFWTESLLHGRSSESVDFKSPRQLKLIRWLIVGQQESSKLRLYEKIDCMLLNENNTKNYQLTGKTRKNSATSFCSFFFNNLNIFRYISLQSVLTSPGWMRRSSMSGDFASLSFHLFHFFGLGLKKNIIKKIKHITMLMQDETKTNEKRTLQQHK